MMSLLGATGWLWEDQLWKSENSFYKDNEGSEISGTQDIQGILFLEIYKHPIVI